MPSRIVDISSPSHRIDKDVLADGHGRVAVIKFSAGDAPIGADFVLRILQETPHQPRAMIEVDDDAPTLRLEWSLSCPTSSSRTSRANSSL